MLRLLSIRNFAVVEELSTECDPGFTVLTGETGAGKSILLDALSLLLGDRFEARQIRPGAERAEIAAEFGIDDVPGLHAWLSEQDLAEDDTLLLRRVFDVQGRSRASINGRPATLTQLRDVGERLIDIHGQHAHQSLARPEAQRALVDAYAGCAVLSRSTAQAWRRWRDAVERQALAEAEGGRLLSQQQALQARADELEELAVTTDEWRELGQNQSRLAHAASLLEAATAADAALDEGDAAIVTRLASLLNKLRQVQRFDPAIEEIGDLIDGARIQLVEAARAVRSYRERVELDPGELARVEERLAAIHDAARKFRVRAEELPELARSTAAELAAIASAWDAEALAAASEKARVEYHAQATELSARRRLAGVELSKRVSANMQDLAMAGGRLEIVLTPLAEPASYGLEDVSFHVATHPKQASGPLARIASGGELSRVGLAIQVVLSQAGEVPTLIFDEVDTGIGGAVAATVGRLLRELGSRKQVLCVTHLPQVAACGEVHLRVTKAGDGDAVRTSIEHLGATARVEELARMLGGLAVTAKTRANARELLLQGSGVPVER